MIDRDEVDDPLVEILGRTEARLLRQLVTATVDALGADSAGHLLGEMVSRADHEVRAGGPPA